MIAAQGLTLSESRDALTTYLAGLSTRCTHGFDRDHQECPDCPSNEWAIFTAALRASVGRDGLIHQSKMRPRIQRIQHKHRGQLYRRAKAEGLIEFSHKEPSTDVAGKNTDKDSPVYRWLGGAEQVAA